MSPLIMAALIAVFQLLVKLMTAWKLDIVRRLSGASQMVLALPLLFPFILLTCTIDDDFKFSMLVY